MKKVRIGIVCTEFNEAIMEKMLDAAISHVEFLNGDVVATLRVPGTWDIPLAAQTLLEQDCIDGVVCLGTIIQGETAHDEVIGHATSKTLQQLSLEFSKPIGFGVAGPKMTYKQAEARAVPFAQHAVKTAIEMHNRIKSLKVKHAKE